MMSLEVMDQEEVDEEFRHIWDENFPDEDHPAIVEAFGAVEKQMQDPEAMRSTLYITDVTLRDGQQQRTNRVTTEQRVEVFDSIVETGVDRIEIGHLGNGNGDQQLAGAIVRRVAEMEQEDERYGRVKLQVLFGSQENLIQQGAAVLQEAFQEQYGDRWQEVMADKVVVHVYDRLDENLRRTSSTPYSDEKSAERIAKAAQHAIDGGFRHFSISAEAATAGTPENAIQFYRSINEYLFTNGAETANVNLANTYGYSPNADWNTTTLAVFNSAVKAGYGDSVSTSIHMHNDVNNAIDFTMAAIVAGFDRVEGTHTGMGERAGNVATVDVMARILEQAKFAVDAEERGPWRRSRIAQAVAGSALRRVVELDSNVADNLHNWHDAGEAISTIFGRHALYRWRRTAIGNLYKFDNGSGPHDQVMAAAVRNPLEFPPYRAYEWAIAPAHIMGSPDAEALAIGDPDAVQQVTVGNHAGGGNTARLIAGDTKREVDDAAVEAARQRFIDYTQQIARHAVAGTVIVMA
jgi:isopropylmalate/homocitrate/citramalate synthase